MRTFSLTVECKNSTELYVALAASAALVKETADRVDTLPVDGQLVFEDEGAEGEAKSVVLARHE